jgi:Spx/MgsR family transcriptional regulator
MIDLFGISNCDKVKKAKKVLQEMGVNYLFVDFKKEQPSIEKILKWKEHLSDWPINKRGTTYRKCKEEFSKADDKEKICLIQKNTSMIYRPILEKNGKILKIGFDEEFFRTL